MRKIWDIHGGVHPPENKSQTNSKPIATIPLAAELVLPLNQHIGAPSRAICSVGQRVGKGEMIATAQGAISAALHAPSSGTVVAIEERPIPHASGMSAPCIVIATDGEDRWTERKVHSNYRGMERAALLQLLRDSGIVGLGGAGFPCAAKVQARDGQKIDTLILNGTECEPYITADDALMRARAEEILSGAEILQHITAAREVVIGIEDNKPEAIAAMRAALGDRKFEVVSFPTKYPSGGEKQLIQILTGKEVPQGGLPADIGILMQNVGTAAAIHRAVNCGEPLISRIVTVVGEALALQQNIEVPIGTPAAHVLACHGLDNARCSRLIVGGPMMGYAMQHADFPVVKTTNCLMAPSREEIPNPAPAQSCIRCGMCAQACPAALLPQQLFWFAQSKDYDKLKSHNLFDCIECGACSYVCPSNIPLVQYYRASKGTLRQQQQDKIKSDRARERFEQHKERLARAEAEREAKRAARKLAAEKARPIPATTVDTPRSDAIDGERAQRAVASAQLKLDQAREQLQAASDQGDTQRIESLQARVKDAELKLNLAMQRLGVGDSAKAKLKTTPEDALEKSRATLATRLAVARQKLAEAEASGSATAPALKSGVEKLEKKLRDLETESIAATSGTVVPDEAERDAAQRAIDRAKQRADELATMSIEEKQRAQLVALQMRLQKAEERLQHAELEQSEHLEVFRSTVEKLKEKLKSHSSDQTGVQS